MMEWWQAIVLGAVEGLTEFLPVSSTGHLTIVEKLMGFQINTPGMTAFTAIIQIGSILAAVIYFRHDIYRVGRAWLQGIFDKKQRKNHDYILGWAIIIGSVPIAVIGLVFKHNIETVLRSLWWVAIMLIAWGLVMWYADRNAKQVRHEKDITTGHALKIGLLQCLALIPGVSRSGATIAGGLLLGFDRVAATRLSFFLGIPALLAAGALEAITQAQYVTESVGWTATFIAMATSFVVGYAAISWMLRFISHHNFTAFIAYRILIGVFLALLLATGTISAT